MICNEAQGIRRLGIATGFGLENMVGVTGNGLTGKWFQQLGSKQKHKVFRRGSAIRHPTRKHFGLFLLSERPLQILSTGEVLHLESPAFESVAVMCLSGLFGLVRLGAGQALSSFPSSCFSNCPHVHWLLARWVKGMGMGRQT